MINLQKLLELTISSREEPRKSFELEQLIKSYIAEESARSRGNINTYKLIKKYIDKAIKKFPHNLKVKGIKINNDKMLFTDTHTAYRLNNILEDLPVIEGYDIDSIIDSTIKRNDIKAETPTLNELKAQLKTAKAIKKARNIDKITTIKEGIVKIHNCYLDITLLIEAIEILGNKDIEVYASEGKLNPVYIKSPMGEAIVLSIRVNTEIENELAS